MCSVRKIGPNLSGDMQQANYRIGYDIGAETRVFAMESGNCMWKICEDLLYIVNGSSLIMHGDATAVENCKDTHTCYVVPREEFYPFNAVPFCWL
ncbi:hypothetical protein Ancab_000828 [Ancistrocladus abbreviatus]